MSYDDEQMRVAKAEAAASAMDALYDTLAHEANTNSSWFDRMGMARAALIAKSAARQFRADNGLT